MSEAQTDMTAAEPATEQRASVPEARPTSLGIYDKPQPGGVTSIEIVAVALSAIWLVGVAIFFMITPSRPPVAEGEGGLRFMTTMLAIFMPVAMIWVAATAARASRVMREESQRLQSAIDAIRHAYISQAQGSGTVSEPSVARKLDEIAAAARKTDCLLYTSPSPRD